MRVELAPLNHLRCLHEGPVLVVLNHQVDEVQTDLVQHIISKVGVMGSAERFFLLEHILITL